MFFPGVFSHRLPVVLVSQCRSILLLAGQSSGQIFSVTFYQLFAIGLFRVTTWLFSYRSPGRVTVRSSSVRHIKLVKLMVSSSLFVVVVLAVVSPMWRLGIMTG